MKIVQHILIMDMIAGGSRSISDEQVSLLISKTLKTFYVDSNCWFNSSESWEIL